MKTRKFGLDIVPNEIFLSYSTQCVFLTIRLPLGKVVMVAIDICRKHTTMGEGMGGRGWIYGIMWKRVYFFYCFCYFYCRYYSYFRISVSCVVTIIVTVAVFVFNYFIYWLIYLFVFLFVYLFIYLIIYLFIYLFIHLFI